MELLGRNVKQRFSEEKKGGFLHFHYHLFAPNGCCKLNRQDSGRDGFNIPQTGRNKFWTKMIFGEQPALSRWRWRWWWRWRWSSLLWAGWASWWLVERVGKEVLNGKLPFRGGGKECLYYRTWLCKSQDGGASEKPLQSATFNSLADLLLHNCFLMNPKWQVAWS